MGTNRNSVAGGSADRRRPRRQCASKLISKAPGVFARNAPGYLFLLPWFIGFFGLTLGPAVASAVSVFLPTITCLQAPHLVRTGELLRRIATGDDKFISSDEGDACFMSCCSVPLKLAFALLVALLLNHGIRGLPVYRAIFYLPSLFGSSVAIAVALAADFRQRRRRQRRCCGTCSASRVRAGFPTRTIRSTTLMVLAIWQFGSPMIIFLA